MIDADRRFWAAIGIGSGLTVFSVGLNALAIDLLRGWITIVCGLLMLAMGFTSAFKRAKGPDAEAPKENATVAPDDKSTPSTPPEGAYRTSLLEQRKSLLAALLDQSRSFDKYVLTLASGALGLSLVFIERIVPRPSAASASYLVGAWICFGASILITLVSFLCSQRACLKQINILNGLLDGSLEKATPNVFTWVTGLLNWLSMLAFMAGVALLTTFSIQNLKFVVGG